MNTKGFLDTDCSHYIIDETISENPKLQKFILDSGADVTVTNDAKLIQNLHEFSNLILTDSGGREHRSQGRGTIQVGGHTLTCYHAPTLKVSVVSVSDLKDLGEDTLFRANGNVYVTNHGSQTFKLIGKEEDNKLFKIRFVGQKAMLRTQFAGLNRENSYPRSINFVGLHNKRDEYNDIFVHEQHGHPN